MTGSQSGVVVVRDEDLAGLELERGSPTFSITRAVPEAIFSPTERPSTMTSAAPSST